jgi:hypothetical protein
VWSPGSIEFLAGEAAARVNPIRSLLHGRSLSVPEKQRGGLHRNVSPSSASGKGTDGGNARTESPAPEGFKWSTSRTISPRKNCTTSERESAPYTSTPSTTAASAALSPGTMRVVGAPWHFCNLYIPAFQLHTSRESTVARDAERRPGFQKSAVPLWSCYAAARLALWSETSSGCVGFNLRFLQICASSFRRNDDNEGVGGRIPCGVAGGFLSSLQMWGRRCADRFK